MVKIIHKTTPIYLFDRGNKGWDRNWTADWMVLLALAIYRPELLIRLFLKQEDFSLKRIDEPNKVV
ncbi:MAG: hypothetical protein VX923_02935 [Pseudomonadota bacterium]|nr:hypothetical protein [Pseudomonadota bacterium]